MWVYILQNEKGNYYIGSTSDIKQRIKDGFIKIAIK